MKTVAKLLAEARSYLGGHKADNAKAIEALCQAIEQHEAWIGGARLVIEAHNTHAIEQMRPVERRNGSGPLFTLEEVNAKVAEAIERIAKLLEGGGFPYPYGIEAAKFVRSSAP